MAGRGPNLSVMNPLSGADTISARLNGSVRTPASKGLKPCTFCRYSVMKNNVPNSAKKLKKLMSTTAVPIDSDRFANRCNGSSGSALRSSITTKTAIANRPATMTPSVLPASHPQFWALMRPNTIRNSPPLSAAIPGMSRRSFCSLRLSTIALAPMANAAAAIGALM